MYLEICVCVCERVYVSLCVCNNKKISRSWIWEYGRVMSRIWGKEREGGKWSKYIIISKVKKFKNIKMFKNSLKYPIWREKKWKVCIGSQSFRFMVNWCTNLGLFRAAHHDGVVQQKMLLLPPRRLKYRQVGL